MPEDASQLPSPQMVRRFETATECHCLWYRISDKIATRVISAPCDLPPAISVTAAVIDVTLAVINAVCAIIVITSAVRSITSGATSTRRTEEEGS